MRTGEQISSENITHNDRCSFQTFDNMCPVFASAKYFVNQVHPNHLRFASVEFLIDTLVTIQRLDWFCIRGFAKNKVLLVCAGRC